MQELILAEVAARAGTLLVVDWQMSTESLLSAHSSLREWDLPALQQGRPAPRFFEKKPGEKSKVYRTQLHELFRNSQFLTEKGSRVARSYLRI